MTDASLEALSDDVLLTVLCELELEDLLHISRVNRRLHELVSDGADSVWQQLHERTFGALDKWSKRDTWRDRFHDRFALRELAPGPLCPLLCAITGIRYVSDRLPAHRPSSSSELLARRCVMLAGILESNGASEWRDRSESCAHKAPFRSAWQTKQSIAARSAAAFLLHITPQNLC